MTPDLQLSATKRSDAARNRIRLLEAAARLVAERGAQHVTMQAIAEEAGVGKATLFRQFGDRNGLLLVLLGEFEAQFRHSYTAGPPPLGPGASAVARLTAFGCALIDRTAADCDPGPALSRHIPLDCRYSSGTWREFHRHVASLLREAGVIGDCDMLAHALLGFLSIELADYLRSTCAVSAARLQAAWEDLVRRVVGSESRQATLG
ncbi:TetR/AcrR family transcriptional regulator [Streptomyces spongiae]|uniref:TetR/AcrR family transcriptional regulator n=1 Tax=Streptomyces spongiae TaxID=565072 RepID=A0A5N8X9S6_9ACTN|nr:helix-turn-helix domain-containing protein [Streptomyces spongiae]MPY55894.1 TetR/AcrR family transcriptional regulator [Streptomyces spongiae]